MADVHLGNALPECLNFMLKEHLSLECDPFERILIHAALAPLTQDCIAYGGPFACTITDTTNVRVTRACPIRDARISSTKIRSEKGVSNAVGLSYSL